MTRGDFNSIKGFGNLINFVTHSEQESWSPKIEDIDHNWALFSKKLTNLDQINNASPYNI